MKQYQQTILYLKGLLYIPFSFEGFDASIVGSFQRT